MDEKSKDDIAFPCGCHGYSVETETERTFVFEPCREDCPTYRFALDEIERQGKPMDVWDLR